MREATGFGPAEMAALLAEGFPPWIRAMDIRPLGPRAGAEAFELPVVDALRRRAGGGPPILCGQAVAAAADTCAVLALCAANGRYRDCATTDLTTQFLRPAAGARVEARVRVLGNGRRRATTAVEFLIPAEDGAPERLAATALCGFAYLED